MQYCKKVSSRLQHSRDICGAMFTSVLYWAAALPKLITKYLIVSLLHKPSQLLIHLLLLHF